MALRGVLFDMGGTLLYFNPPGESWEGMEKIGALGAYRLLSEQNYLLPPEQEALELAWTYARDLWADLNAHPPKNLKLGYQMSLLAGQWGIADLAEDIIEALAQAYMTAIRTHVRPLEGAVETLCALRERGLRVGLISNTMWPGVIHLHDLEQQGLMPYLEHLVFSADVEAWKPNREIFELGLVALDLAPDEAAYVGDSMYFDVWGAQRAGMRGVWIEQPFTWLPDGVEVIPDATIKTLPELLDVVDDWT
jgi:putative hydrolase of the HAD superfamily